MHRAPYTSKRNLMLGEPISTSGVTFHICLHACVSIIALHHANRVVLMNGWLETFAFGIIKTVSHARSPSEHIHVILRTENTLKATLNSALLLENVPLLVFQGYLALHS